MTADGGISFFLVESSNFKATLKLLCTKGKHVRARDRQKRKPAKEVSKIFPEKFNQGHCKCESSQSTKHETLFVRNSGLGAKTLK